MTNEDDATVTGRAARGQVGRDVRPHGRGGAASSGTSGEAAGTSGWRDLLPRRWRGLDRRELTLGWLIIMGVAVGVMTVNVMTTLADMPGVRIWEPWIWEFSSLAMVALLTWIPWLSSTVASPVEDGPAGPPGWLRLAVVHLAALLLYTSLHVAGFVALRILAYNVLEAGPYQFDALGSAPTRFLYELRKDLLSYVSFVAVFSGVAWVRRRRDDAVRQVSFDIPDGSRIIRTAPGDILAVSSAGNYVEFWLVDGRRPLMRATLAGLESELGASRFVRAHRSWLINIDRVTGLRPDGSGDWTVELGQVEAPMSRRYPRAIERLKG